MADIDQRALQDIMRGLGRVEGKVEAIHRELSILNHSQSEVEIRVDKLEEQRDTTRGALAAVGFLGGAVGGVVALLARFFGV